MTSPKYPNWMINETKNGYTMTRPDWEAKGIFYTIAVSQDTQGWFAELLTRRNDRYSANGWSWETARNECYGKVAKVVAEAERRAEYWQSQK